MRGNYPRKGDVSEEDIKKTTQLEGHVLPLTAVAKCPHAIELISKFEIRYKSASVLTTDSRTSPSNHFNATYKG